MIENIADLAHFMPVHNTLIDDFKVIIDGPRATQRSLGRGHNLKGEPIPVVSVATYHGPAIQFTHLEWAYDMVLINAHIPIEENKLLLRFGVILKAGEGVTLPPAVLEAHVAAARNGYFEDVAIWENKRWRDQPDLCGRRWPHRRGPEVVYFVLLRRHRALTRASDVHARLEDRYLIVSTDGHAGLLPEKYRDYVDPQYRDAL